jgi:ribose transport system ATP-binding protein
MPVSKEYAIQMFNIDKHFGGIYALRNVNFNLKRGTIHALVGENGAGKSTLMKILTGSITKDAGTIYMEGQKIEPKNYAHAQKIGIALVPQELALVDYFTVAENIFLGRESRLKGTCLIDWKRLYRECEKLLEDMNIDLKPDAYVKDLSVSEQQMLVIARILSQNAGVILLDEPTARLGYHEIKRLLDYVKYLRDNGKSIIYISHRIEEIFQIADEVTVLRDGIVVGNNPVSQLDSAALIRMMVNRTVEFTDEFLRGRVYGDEILRIEGLSRSSLVKDISFSLRKGEVLGFFGLVGAGRTEMIRSLLGVDKKTRGDIYLEGKKVDFKNISVSIASGLALVPEERRKQGLVLPLSVRENVVLGSLKKFSRLGFIDKKREWEAVNVSVDRVNLQRQGIDQKAGELSGGNQQTVVLAKLLARGGVKIYIFDEPTRGIDVGAKSGIYQLISGIAAAGTPSIVISSEIPELQTLCDRVIVMKEGRINGILSREQIREPEEILKYAIGG